MARMAAGPLLLRTRRYTQAVVMPESKTNPSGADAKPKKYSDLLSRNCFPDKEEGWLIPFVGVCLQVCDDYIHPFR